MSDEMGAPPPSGESGVLGAAKRWYEGLPKAQRLNLFKVVSIAVVVGVLLAVYAGTRGGEREKKTAANKPVTTVELGDSRLEDDIRAQYERDNQDNQQTNKQQDKSIEEQDAKLEAQQKQLELMQQALASMTGTELGPTAKRPSQETPPDDPGVWANNSGKSGTALNRTPASAMNAPPVPIPVTFVGDIGLAADPVTANVRKTASGAAGERSSAPEQGGKKNSRKFFLPTSFMPAKLLTGLKAKTVDSAKEDPEPMLLRIQAPAVLPNEVRAQLQGCFVIAHGYGSLASERVEARLVSLSCVDYEGRSIIEEEITGILVDKDGVKGLAGHPVTKMGANLSRMFVAGLVDGVGQAYERTATTTSISPLGQTTTIDPDKVAQAGVGRGVSSAAGELTKIYADLVRQSAPVIEVGPSKEVSVLLTQGVWLEVQEYEQAATVH